MDDEDCILENIEDRIYQECARLTIKSDVVTINLVILEEEEDMVK